MEQLKLDDLLLQCPRVVANSIKILKRNRIDTFERALVDGLGKATLVYVESVIRKKQQDYVFRIVPITESEAVTYRKNDSPESIQIEPQISKDMPRYDLLTCDYFIKGKYYSFENILEHSCTPKEHIHKIPKNIQNKDISVFGFDFYNQALKALYLEREERRGRRNKFLNRKRF